MTPQLMQAIKLLQLSNLDLAAYVEDELERNPLLERAARRRAGARPSRPRRTGDGDGGAERRDRSTGPSDDVNQLGGDGGSVSTPRRERASRR